MSPMLAWEMEKRGQHSWGTTDGYEIVKHVGPILDTYELPNHWKQAIFHTRHATHGDVTVVNQHPFEFQAADNARIIGIHNGIITSHQGLNTKYSRDFPVDSMHVYAHIAANLPLSELTGYGALAWYRVIDPTPDSLGTPPVLHLARFNMYDLHVASLKSGEIVFASLKEPIEKAARWARTEIECFYKVEENHLYTVRLALADETDQLYELADGGPVSFGHRWTTTHTSYTPYIYTGVTYQSGKSDKSKCLQCKTTGLDKPEHLYCHTCYAKARDAARRVIESYGYAQSRAKTGNPIEVCGYN